MKTVLSFLLTVFFSTNSFSQSSAEVMCRAQAKEAAVQTYSGCITQARNNKIEEIRKNYQKDLAQLKSKYDQELKQLAGSKKSSKKASSAPTKGLAKELPSKAPVEASEVLPVQSVSEGVKVMEADPLEKEAAQAEQSDLIEMPVQ